MRCGGFSSAILELLEELPLQNLKVDIIALPCAFIPQGKRDFLIDRYGMSVKALVERAKSQTKQYNEKQKKETQRKDTPGKM